jgi:hypothetical protein
MEHNNIPSHTKTSNLGGNGNKAGAKFDIPSEIKRLQAIYKGLSREKTQVLLYLAEVYKSAGQLRTQKKSDVLRQIRDYSHLTLDARISSTPYRLLIELTCTCDIKLKSRYANALMFARLKRCTASQLKLFIKAYGGIEKCACAYLLEKRRRKGINLPTRLKRTSR